MLSSTELIAAFDECESRIGKEKATPFNMFCEGFFLRELMEKSIPLTADILLANGFEKLSDTWGRKHYNHYDSDNIRDFEVYELADDDGIKLYVSIGGDMRPVKYVYQLQQLFRLAGLAKEAKNFKIDAKKYETKSNDTITRI